MECNCKLNLSCFLLLILIVPTTSTSMLNLRTLLRVWTPNSLSRGNLNLLSVLKIKEITQESVTKGAFVSVLALANGRMGPITLAIGCRTRGMEMGSL